MKETFNKKFFKQITYVHCPLDALGIEVPKQIATVKCLRKKKNFTIFERD